MSWISDFFKVITGSTGNSERGQHNRFKFPYSERRSGKHVHDWAEHNTRTGRSREGSHGEHSRKGQRAR